MKDAVSSPGLGHSSIIENVVARYTNSPPPHTIHFIYQVEELEAGTPGRLKVTAKSTESDETIEGEYNTVRTH